MVSKTFPGLSIRVFLLFLLGGLSGAAAAEQTQTLDLFDKGTLRRGAPAGETVPGIRPEAVGAVSYFSLSGAASRSLRSGESVSRSLRIALPKGNSVTCSFARGTQEDDGLVLEGSVPGNVPSDRCDLVVSDGKVVGDVQIGTSRYRIVPVGQGNTHAVVEVKTKAYPNEGDIPVPGEKPRSMRDMRDEERCDVKPAGGGVKEFGPIRVMILYTPAARRESPNIRSEIRLLMRQLNEAFQRTGGNFVIKAELAHAQEVDYQEAAKMQADLHRLSGIEPGYFDFVPELRDRHQADLVHLLISKVEPNTCGIGWMPPPYALNAGRGFSVSDRECAVNNYSFVHELGHNFGLNHDRYAVPDADPDDFNFGYVAKRSRIRTVMAYNNECRDANEDCERLLLFSSPSRKVSGATMGRPYTRQYGAYNTEILCRTAPVVAEYKGPPVAAPRPPAPAPISEVTYTVLSNVSEGVLNLRRGPAVAYPIVVAIPAGAGGITLSGCKSSEDGSKPWCAAQWHTYRGWISSCCIVDQSGRRPMGN
jgi:hypothetical protein